MIASALIIISLSLILCNYYQNMVKLRKSKLPTLKYALPLLGHTLYFFGPTQVFFSKMFRILVKCKKFGMIFGTVFMTFLYDHKTLTKFFSTEDHIQHKSFHYKFLETLGERNIFKTTGSIYRESKKVLIEAVSHGNLKGYITSFNQNSKLLAENLKSKIGQKEFNLEPELNFCIVSNLLDTVVGLDSSFMTKEEIIKFSEELSSLLSNIVYRTYCFWLYPDFIFKMTNLYKRMMSSRTFLRAICERLIIARREKIESNKADDAPFSVFIDKYFKIKKDNGESFSTDDIIDDVLSILTGGIETTVSSIGFVLMLLAMYPDVQQKVHEEIDNLNVDELDFKTSNELDYFDRVLHETWRLFPPISAIGRRVSKDTELDNGGVLEKGTDVYIVITMLHRDRDVYPHPMAFNPDNFLPENVAARPPMSYIPFSVGYRKCFGNVFAKLIIKTVIYHLLKSYEFSTTKTMKDFKLAFEIILKNKIGVPVSITSRV